MSMEERYNKFMTNKILYACSTSGQIVIDVNYFHNVDPETFKKKRMIRVEPHVYVSGERGWGNSSNITQVCKRLGRCYRVFCTRDSESSRKYATKLMTSITKHFGISFITGINAYMLHTLFADRDFVDSGLAIELSLSTKKKPIYLKWIKNAVNGYKLSHVAALKLYSQ